MGHSALVRLEDVARLAGVSAITVSRALRQPEKVARKTQRRVAVAVESLGYVPNLVAGALASARSGVIAVLLPTITNPIFASTIDGLTEVLEGDGYAILMAQSGYDAAREARMIKALLGRRPEGIVLVGSPITVEATTMLKAAVRGGVVVIETWELPPKPIDLAVGFDNGAAGAAAASYLLARGRRKLGFIGGGDRRALARWRVFARTAKAAGAIATRLELPVPPLMDNVAAAITADNVPSGIAEADAIFAANDIHAVGLLSALRMHQRRVPEDVAVIGLGDLQMGRYSSPTLTTIAIDGNEIGRCAAEAFKARVRRGVVPQHADVGFTVIQRESS